MVLPSSLFFFLKEGERAASCDLRWMQGYRGGRLGDGEHLEWSFQARLLLAPKRWIGLRLRLARGAGRCHSDRLLAMARRSVRRSIRAKPRIDQVCGAKEWRRTAVLPLAWAAMAYPPPPPSLRSQAAAAPCGFTSR